MYICQNGKDLSLRTVKVMRYIVPLREGGSLPALAEADDGFKYVLKFRGGAGHGTKMLVSELLGGRIASVLGLHNPELVFATLDDDFGRSEGGDEEIQDLLKGSEGLNLGLHYLSGAIAYDPPWRSILFWHQRLSGSMRSPPISTAPSTTPTCCGGTVSCGSSTTALRFISITPGTISNDMPSTRFPPHTRSCIATPPGNDARRGKRFCT